VATAALLGRQTSRCGALGGLRPPASIDAYPSLDAMLTPSNQSLGDTRTLSDPGRRGLSIGSAVRLPARPRRSRPCAFAESDRFIGGFDPLPIHSSQDSATCARSPWVHRRYTLVRKENPSDSGRAKSPRTAQRRGAATRAMSGSGMPPPTCRKGAGARRKPNSSTAEPELDSASADHDHVN
jgi:hypothetical protein